MKIILTLFLLSSFGCVHAADRKVANYDSSDLKLLSSVLSAEKDKGITYLNSLGVDVARNSQADLVSIDMRGLFEREKKVGAQRLASDFGVLINRDPSGKLIDIKF
jgi:hypothetical protein